MEGCKDTNKDLRAEFERFSTTTSQRDFQLYLETIYDTQGLIPVLDKISQWEYHTGYITDSKLNDNLHFEYPDELETGLVFRTQINYARSNYTPLPLDGKDVPKLHCPICIENVGIPGKENLRVFEFLLNGKDFFIQMTPFPLFKNHFVAVSKRIRGMIMDHESVEDLATFVDMCPSYTACSNSDVEWAGASILSHHHYQVFDSLLLPVMQAKACQECQMSRANSLIEMLDFPIGCIRVSGTDRSGFVTNMGELIREWKQQKPGENTCNLIIYKQAEHHRYNGIIIFRNPAYRTPPDLTHIKSEGVGIIEVAGEGIYPVPKESEVLERIETQGLDVIKGIIQGNNPIRGSYKEFFLSITNPK